MDMLWHVIYWHIVIIVAVSDAGSDERLCSCQRSFIVAAVIAW